MSEALVPVVITAVTELIPLVRTLLDQAKNGTVPTAEQEAAVNAALDNAESIIAAA